MGSVTHLQQTDGEIPTNSYEMVHHPNTLLLGACHQSRPAGPASQYDVSTSCSLRHQRLLVMSGSIAFFSEPQHHNTSIPNQVSPSSSLDASDTVVPIVQLHLQHHNLKTQRPSKNAYNQQQAARLTVSRTAPTAAHTILGKQHHVSPLLGFVSPPQT